MVTVALPFCDVTLRGQKPASAAYPRELGTLGDHLRKRRLDLGLRQEDVAKRLGTKVNTVTNWEANRTKPALRFLPGIVRFLGHLPFSASGTVPERLKVYRRARGLSQEELARKLHVNPSTLARWENGRGRPSPERAHQVERVLSAGTVSTEP